MLDMQGHKEVVEALIEAGAAVNARESDGNESTPFDYAMFSDHEQLAFLLVRMCCRRRACVCVC